MGKTFGSIASSVGSGGSVLGGIGKVFNPNSDEVAGTGQTVGDLKNIGYTPQDIATLGGGKPSRAIALTRGAIGGGLAAAGGQYPQMYNNVDPAYRQRNPFYGGY